MQNTLENMKANSAFLARKMDHSRRMVEHFNYFQKYLPEVFNSEGQKFIDIGPGPGESIQIAKMFGMKAEGIDSDSGEGGMGSEYLEYCKEYQRIHNIKVTRTPELNYHKFQNVKVLNSRGSIEQICHRVMIGDPHHLHHDCKLLEWDESRAVKYLSYFLWSCRCMVSDDGVFMISANGAANTQFYDNTIMAIYRSSGCWESIERFDETHHKLYASDRVIKTKG